MTQAKPKAETEPKLRPLPVLLLRARALVAGHFRPVLREHNLTEQQWRVLRALWDVGPLDVSQLSLRTDLLPSSLSRILRDLADRNLLVRTVPKSDGRRVLTLLTGAGNKLAQQTITDLEPLYTSLAGRLGVKRSRDLQTLLEETVAILQEDD